MYTDVFKSGGNILGRRASKRKNKLFIIKFPQFKGNLTINNLFSRFEALWSKILPPDLERQCTFFTHPLVDIHCLLEAFKGGKNMKL